MSPRSSLAALLLLAAPAAAQTTLHALRANGDLLRISPVTGGASLQGATGLPCNAAAGFTRHGIDGTDAYIFVVGPAPGGDRITTLDRWSGAHGPSTAITGIPAGYHVRALAVSTMYEPADMYCLLAADDPAADDLVGSIAVQTMACSIIAPSGRTDLESIAVHAGVVYALGAAGGGARYSISFGSPATLIGHGDYGDASTLAFLGDGTLLACGSDLLRVNTGTGATTRIGPTGYSDIRALATVGDCYVNCAHTNSPPVLNVLDFNCFISRFVAGSPYANCDGSAAEPVLNILDFSCFLNRFAGGCSAP